MSRTLVVIPTYNERENVEAIAARVLAIPEVELLVVDDNSPDGTGEIADTLSYASPRVHVLHRPGKGGLGAAYRAGFAWGIGHEFEVLVELDGDGSHQPEQLTRLLNRMEDADVVLGSRWVPGGSVANWKRSRQLLSRGSSWYARFWLGMPFRDITGGYRAFSSEALIALGYDEVRSQGYCFQVEMLYRAWLSKLEIAEVPITFVEREFGYSKMSLRIVVEAMVRVTVWGVSRVLRQPAFTVLRISTPTSAVEASRV